MEIYRNKITELKNMDNFKVYDTSGTFPCGSRRKNLNQPVNL